jgi:hypothetical protein
MGNNQDKKLEVQLFRASFPVSRDAAIAILSKQILKRSVQQYSIATIFA